MTDRLVAIDLDQPAGEQLPEQFRTEVEYLVEASLSAYDSSAVAVFERMDVSPDRDRRHAIDTLIRTLKDYDLWDRIDGFYMFAAHTSQAALLNWRRDTANMVAVNAPYFTEDRGFKGDGISSYLWNTQAATVHMAPTDIAMSLWISDNKTVGSWDVSMSGWDCRLYGDVDNNRMSFRVSSATSTNVTVSSANQPGLHTITRADTTNKQLYKDGGLLSDIADAYNSGGSYPTVQPIYLGVTSGTSGFTNSRYSMFAYGGAMDAGESALFYNTVNTYMQAIGLV